MNFQDELFNTGTFMELIKTDDGSYTCRSADLDECYHTKSGALDEAFRKHTLPLKVWEGVDSGVGGGILAVIPGKFGIGIVSPPLDKYGNSVRAQLAAKYIIEKLNLNPLAQ